MLNDEGGGHGLDAAEASEEEGEVERAATVDTCEAAVETCASVATWCWCSGRESLSARWRRCFGGCWQECATFERQTQRGRTAGIAK